MVTRVQAPLVAGARARRLWLSIFLALAGAILLSVGATAADNKGFETVVVGEHRFYPELQHSLADLTGTLASGETFVADFYRNFRETGGVERWGLPTSAIFAEAPETLTQYYQRGVIDWRRPTSGGSHTFERRLAWDYVGGGLGGAPDFGVEPGLTNPNPGLELGPWGHKVSDTSIEGTPTGFREFFERLGGVQTFGLPKTDARSDLHPNAVVRDPTQPADSRIRQYFQAAVFEFHPESTIAPVKLRLIGDVVRDARYPNNAWQSVLAFMPEVPLRRNEAIGVDLARPPYATVGTPLPERAITDVVASVRDSLLRVSVELLPEIGGGSPEPVAEDACASAFYINDSGLALTNFHVIDGASRVSVTDANGTTHDAAVLAGTIGRDLALLQVDVPASTPVVWGDSDAVQLGEQLIVLGFPVTIVGDGTSCSSGPTVTTGLLSTTTRAIGLDFMQTDAALNPGNSGGPVHVADARVVAVAVAGAIGLQNVNFLIPTKSILPYLNHWMAILASGQAPPVPGPFIVDEGAFTLGETRRGSLDARQTTRWTLDAQQGDFLKFEAWGMDTVLAVYRPDGELLMENDDGRVDDLGSRIVTFMPEDGTYVVELTGFGGQSGNYTIVIVREPARQKGELTPEIVGQGDLAPYDREIWTVTIEEGQIFDIQTFGLDTIVEVYDADYEFITRVDEGGIAGGSLVSVEGGIAGTYIVVVFAFLDIEGSYEISVDIFSEATVGAAPSA